MTAFISNLGISTMSEKKSNAFLKSKVLFFVCDDIFLKYGRTLAICPPNRRDLYSTLKHSKNLLDKFTDSDR